MTLNNTTVQVYSEKRIRKTDRNGRSNGFYNRKKRAPMYNFMHTLDKWQNPDTLSIDPLSIYDLEVFTIPHLKDSIRFKPGVHNIVELDAGQGELTVNVNSSGGRFPGMKVLIKDPATSEIIHVQNMNSSTKLLIGEYDLEILTLPRIKFEKVKIKQSKRTTIEIQQPGNLNIVYPATGNGCIYKMEGDQQQWVCPLQANELVEMFVMQPGKYKLVFRSDRSRRAAYTVEKILEYPQDPNYRFKFITSMKEFNVLGNQDTRSGFGDGLLQARTRE